MNIMGITIEPDHSVDLLVDESAIIENGNDDAFLLLLQDKPINKKVVQQRPFVMNSVEEIQQAFNDYRKTQFCGWP